LILLIQFLTVKLRQASEDGLYFGARECNLVAEVDFNLGRAVVRWMVGSKGDVLGSKSGVLGSKSAVLGSKSAVLGSKGDVMGSKSGVLGSKGDVMGSKGAVLGSKGGVLGSKSAVLGSKGDVLGSKGDVLGSKSGVLDGVVARRAVRRLGFVSGLLFGPGIIEVQSGLAFASLHEKLCRCEHRARKTRIVGV